MREQKLLSKVSLLIAIVTLITAIIIEVIPSSYVTISCLKGHRNFGVSLFLGISSGAFFSVLTTRMLFLMQKGKTVNLLVNNLISIKRYIYDAEAHNSSISMNAEKIRNVCNEILTNPENWELENEITLEQDFVDAIKDIERLCMLHEQLMDKKFMIGQYIDRYVSSILKQCHVKSEEFDSLLRYYDIKSK